MKKGSLVLDWTTKQFAIIVSQKPALIDSNGNKMTWDFQVFSSGNIYYVDSDDLEAISESGR